MAAQTCPSCGKELPAELGQHATAPVSGLVTCPHCGVDVHLERAATGETAGEQGETESFAGHETVNGVMDEVQRKQQGSPGD